MQVKFFATFRLITGEKETNRFTASTLEELLHKLCAYYGGEFAAKLFVNGNLSRDVIILVNGRAIEHLNGLQTVLHPDDQVAVFPRLAGG